MRVAETRPVRLLRVVLLIACTGLVGSLAQAQPSGQPSPAVAASVADAVAAATVDAPPAPVRLTNRVVAVLRATVTMRTPAIRAAGAERLIQDLLAAAAPPGPVSTRPLGGAQVITIGSQDVFALLPADLDPAGTQTLEQVAADVVGRLQTAVDEVIEARTPRQLASGAVLAILATVALAGLLWLLVRGHFFVAGMATRAADRQLSRLPGADVLGTSRFSEIMRYLVSVASGAIALFFLYSWLTFVLRRFPYTRPMGEALRGFLFERLIAFGSTILNSVPDLFTVVLIVLFTRMLAKIAALVFHAAEEGRASIPGIYPETAQPTRRLVTGFLWLFALALAYPLLPGSNTDAFKGVSVFVGLMISLGSSGIINQIMSGMTLTYSRALRLGDYVRIGDLEGTVTQLGGLSTKLKTPRNEEVTIPNAVVVSTQTTNYSRFAPTEGVFVPTSITIGYDAPWRQVQALLLMAAARTAGVRPSPAPVVWQTGLRDFYVEYTLLVCLENQALRGPIVDRLNGHIQDAFNEHGVQIMSPNYEADPEGPKMVPPDRWYASPALPAER